MRVAKVVKKWWLVGFILLGLACSSIGMPGSGGDETQAETSVEASPVAESSPAAESSPTGPTDAATKASSSSPTATPTPTPTANSSRRPSR